MLENLEKTSGPLHEDILEVFERRVERKREVIVTVKQQLLHDSVDRKDELVDQPVARPKT